MSLERSPFPEVQALYQDVFCSPAFREELLNFWQVGGGRSSRFRRLRAHGALLRRYGPGLGGGRGRSIDGQRSEKRFDQTWGK